jgi:hypothetical protein
MSYDTRQIPENECCTRLFQVFWKRFKTSVSYGTSKIPENECCTRLFQVFWKRFKTSVSYDTSQIPENECCTRLFQVFWKHFKSLWMYSYLYFSALWQGFKCFTIIPVVRSHSHEYFACLGVLQQIWKLAVFIRVDILVWPWICVACPLILVYIWN